MKTRVSLFFLISLFICGFSLQALSFAEDMNAVRTRMEERLPVIAELKVRGIVGEDKMGYLQCIGKNREKEDIVQTENQDRRTVYGSIAKKEGVSIEQVGQRRALQIAAKAKKGEWLQGQDGKWYQK